MVNAIKQSLLTNLKNIPGWKTKRKIVIIECDDWGGIRMPSKETFDSLCRSGVNFTPGWFNMYDTLETGKDLELLFDTLYSVKDRNNKPAVVTPVTVMANPDFDKIKSSGFTEYHYEIFTSTLKRYYPDDDVFKLWHEGITAGIFLPELHGRDHITVNLWLDRLREGDKDLLIAFDHGFVSLDIAGTPVPAKEFRAEFYFTSEDQKAFMVNSIKEGVALFREVFGYLPRVFVPGEGIFHPDFEHVVTESGVKFLYVNHSMPYPVIGSEMKYRNFITGQKGANGLTYYTRNCAFEPASIYYSGIDQTMNQIAAAFRWSKPAAISTHRVNFAGGIDPGNREKGLGELKKLLKAIVRKWPDVEFMGSGDALDYIRSNN